MSTAARCGRACRAAWRAVSCIPTTSTRRSESAIPSDRQHTARCAAISALALLLGSAHGVAAPQAGAGTRADCAGFRRDTRQELEVFGTEAARIAGGAEPGAATAIVAERLYEVTLRPQAEVRLLRPPQAHRVVEAPFAGLLAIDIRGGGHYRISTDGPVWIDAIDGTADVVATAFSGRARCPLIHKSVDIVFPAGTHVLLQLGQSPRAIVRIAVTPSPPAGTAAPS